MYAAPMYLMPVGQHQDSTPHIPSAPYLQIDPIQAHTRLPLMR